MLEWTVGHFFFSLCICASSTLWFCFWLTPFLLRLKCKPDKEGIYMKEISHQRERERERVRERERERESGVPFSDSLTSVTKIVLGSQWGGEAPFFIQINSLSLSLSFYSVTTLLSLLSIPTIISSLTNRHFTYCRYLIATATRYDK